MAPSTPEKGPPARQATLETSLTLNKKQSWFGSIKSAVHQSALSAKAAVESLRGGAGGSNNSASLAQDDHDSHRTSIGTTQSKRSTQSRLSGREGVATAKTAVSSLRQQLNRRSRNSKRGSISDVFRRTNSNASSLRGAQGPDAYYRNSVELSGATSPLAKDQDSELDKDSATSIPLPSSPIAIPSPQLPKLNIDLMPSIYDEFLRMEARDTKVLQDPRNITSGVSSLPHPLAWDCGRRDPRVIQHDSSIAAESSPGCCLKKPSLAAGPCPLLQSPFIERDDPFRQESPMPGTTLCLEVDDAKQEESKHALKNEDAMPQTTDRAARDGSAFLMGQRGKTAAKDEESMGVNSKTSPPPSQLTILQFEEPISVASCSGVQHAGGASAKPFDVLPAETYNETLAMTPPSDHIHPSVIQESHQRSSRMLPAELDDGRSDSILTQPSDTPHYFEGADPQAAFSALDHVETDVSERQEGKEFQAPRKDSLLDDIEKSIPQHGPPSLTGSVRLPLRPKAAPLTKQSSYDFKPILDRLAVKNLNIMRPGSDPTLRQRYLPHVTVDASKIVEYPRQTSLDSDSSKASGESNDTSGIFERAVEPISPLHIRKQVVVTPTKTTQSPHTPRETVDPQTPGSSPFRTPSMGDRQQFDKQRAERNARYKAIHSGSDFDFQLADFEHAGPGSRGSTPGRNSTDVGSDMGDSPSRYEHALPAAQASHSVRREGFLALSKD